jgi:hypothetical protein
MKKYILLLIIVFIGCITTKPTTKLIEKELFEKLSNGFIIQKLPNWTFHDFHGVLNYTPTDLMSVGKEYIYNGITASNKKANGKTLQSIVDKDVNERMSFVKITNFKMFKKQTKYGESILLYYDVDVNGSKYKTIKQYYLHNDRVYRVYFSARKKYFDTYSKEAIQIMETFTITK